MMGRLTLSAFVALCAGVLGKSLQSQTVVLGSMSLGGVPPRVVWTAVQRNSLAAR